MNFLIVFLFFFNSTTYFVFFINLSGWSETQKSDLFPFREGHIPKSFQVYLLRLLREEDSKLAAFLSNVVLKRDSEKYKKPEEC